MPMLPLDCCEHSEMNRGFLIADITDHLVSLSCSEQSSRLSIFKHVDAVKKLVEKIRLMSSDYFSVEDKTGS